jgi:LysM repeat protein
MNKEESKPISFKGAVGVVAGLHVLAGIGIFYASIPKSYAEDKKFLNTTEIQYAGVDNPTPASTPIPTPTPTPTPLKTKVMPDGKVATYPPPPTPTPSPTPERTKEVIVKKVDSKYTQTYTIKKGDTIHSISKRYGLNTKKLLQINHITNPSKVREGQVLKFL